MSIEVWPFLVSRNRYFDYRTIAAPDFICDAKVSNLLAKVAEGGLTKPDELRIRQIVNSKVDDFTIIFQVVTAKEKDINPEGDNEVLKDQFGREIYLFQGVVIKNIGEDYFYVTDKVIEIAHKELIEIYRKFWNYTEIYSPISLGRFSIEKKISELSLKRKVKPRFNASPQRALKLKVCKNFDKKIESIAFSRDGKSIAIKNSSLKTFIWYYMLNNHGFDVIKVLKAGTRFDFSAYGNDHSICFSPDGKFIATSTIGVVNENLIEIYNLELQNNKKVLRGHAPSKMGRINSITFSPNGDLFSCSEDKYVKRWNILKEESNTLLKHDYPVKTIAISGDGYRVAYGDAHQKIKVWNLKDKKEEYSIETKLLSVKSIAFSPDDQILVAAGETIYDDHFMQVWDLSIGRNEEIPLCDKDPHCDVINSLAFSPDGQILASAGKDKKIVFWKINSKIEICLLSPPIESAHDDEITSITFAPQGNYLASGGKDKKVKIWSF